MGKAGALGPVMEGRRGWQSGSSQREPIQATEQSHPPASMSIRPERADRA